MPKLINMALISNPLNWAIVTTMVLLSAAGAAMISEYIDSKGNN